jgi:hypothetical protein
MNKFVGKGRMVRNTVVNGFSNKALSFIVAGQRISPTHVCECITEATLKSRKKVQIIRSDYLKKF